MLLSAHELKRYDRHIKLAGFGIDCQEKLKQAKVLCIGAGGLGCATLPYLAAAGIGKLVVVDFDQVELSNLQRQVFFTTEDIGKNKAEVLVARLKQLNDAIEITACDYELTAASAQKPFTDLELADFDLVIDASDNFTTRYLINDLCSYFTKPFVSAAVDQFDGQCFLLQPDKTDQPCYRCLFPEADRELANCNQAGVLGVLPGVIGTFQANLAIYALLGRAAQYANQLFYYHGTQLCWKRIKIQADANCISYYHGKLPSDINPYEHQTHQTHPSSYVTNDELAKYLTQHTRLQLIDVREYHEYQQNHFHQALSAPLSEIKQRPKLDDFIKNGDIPPSDDQFIILYCQRGPRSEKAYRILKKQGYKRLRILQGGMTDCLQNPKLKESISEPGSR